LEKKEEPKSMRDELEEIKEYAAEDADINLSATVFCRIGKTETKKLLKRWKLWQKYWLIWKRKASEWMSIF
jgi:hypothetical protein